MRVEQGTLTIESTPRGAKISFLTRDLEEVDKLVGEGGKKALNAEIKPIREKRSYSANAYHYVLCDKMAKAVGISANELHFTLMADYGTPFKDADGRHQYVLLKDYKPLIGTGAYVRGTGHYEQRPNGDEYQWFIVIKPSHLYDTAEMSRLLDGTIAEAKELGIVTETPAEIARMKALWGE